jgi:acyl dehydratase
MAEKEDDPTKPDVGLLLFRHAFGFFVDGWMLMLALGVAHASSRVVPALGYWQSTFLAWVLEGIVVTGHVELRERIKKLGKIVDPGNYWPWGRTAK